ncbi:hypothetical protein GJ744_010489 [Endocarpon pusillum]|uniref:Uncharacterized protein n=1 Tax=Endocarpon pusillum TaxID=364733 RepID=A0A8H7E3L1_9EURO|nr:hypothetical protein GJ744_010489 [Endocarpon pusillum]
MERVSPDWETRDANALKGVGIPEPDPMPRWHSLELENERLDFWWVPDRDAKGKTGVGKVSKAAAQTAKPTTSPKSAREGAPKEAEERDRAVK